MPALQIEQFADLVQTTLANFGEPDYTDLMSDLTDAVAANELIQKNSMKVKTGKSCEWRVKVNSGDAARHIAITDHDQVNIVDGFITASVNWRKSETKYAFYEEELSMNMTPKRIVDLVKSREDGANVSWIELLEDTYWGFPAASDVRTPSGLPYYVTKNATTGFNGGIPTGYSSVAGISPTTYPRWNNYTGQYVSVTPDDFLLMARTMMKKTSWKPLVKGIPSNNTGNNRAFYTNLSVSQKLENLVDSRNDNIGPDLARYEDGVVLGRTPVKYVPKLDADTTDPFYQINWGTMKIYVHSGWWQRRTRVDRYPGQRNVVAVFIDSIWQIVCNNRRANGVLALGTTYPS